MPLSKCGSFTRRSKRPIVFCSLYSRMEKKTIRRFGQWTKRSKWKAALRRIYLLSLSIHKRLDIKFVATWIRHSRKSKTNTSIRNYWNRKVPLMLVWGLWSPWLDNVVKFRAVFTRNHEPGKSVMKKKNVELPYKRNIELYSLNVCNNNVHEPEERV